MFIQIEAPVTQTSLLITAIAALSAVVVVLFFYNKALNKEIKAMSESFTNKLQDVYKEQLKDHKELIEKNTKAFVEHTNAVKENSQVTKELREAISETSFEQTKALTETRLWLKENYGK